MGRLDTLGYDELLAEAEPYLRRYASDGGGSAPAAPTAGPSGGPKGGQFALGGGRVGAKPKGRPARRPHGQGQQHPATFGWDGRHGTGYGSKDGDPHVHDLQEAINLLGITDSHGQALKDDGKFGPRTDSAVKKLQKRLGMEQTGQVTQEFIDQVVRIAQKVARGRKPRRKPAAHRSADDEERDPASYGLLADDAEAAAYGRIALAGDPWLRERAGGILRGGLPELPLGDDDMVAALLVALAELVGDDLGLRAFNPAQKRIPKGQPGAGRFMSMVDRIKGAIEEHLKGKGDGHPLDDFSREQLRKVAKARGIELKRGESRDSIAERLLEHLKGNGGGESMPKTSKPKAPLASEHAPELPFEERVKAAARGRKALDAAPLSLLPRSRNDPALTPERRKLLGDYKVGEASDVELALRQGGEVPAETAHRIGVLDGIMADSPLAADAQLYRTFPTARDYFGDAATGDLTGHEWRENSFFLATSSRPYELGTPGARGMVMRILAPKGTGAVALSGATAELLLDRKHTWRVVKDHGRNKDGLRLVDVEILPKTGDEPDNFTVVTPNVTTADNPLGADIRATLPDTPLGRGLRSGIAGSESLSGGAVGDVRLTTFDDGSRAVQKVASKTFAGRTTRDLTDSEELGGLLGRSIGAPVPEVVRTGDAEVFMEFVPDARPGAAVLNRYKPVERGGKFGNFIDSREGRLLGILDLITGNVDRHKNNWLVRRDGGITGIDHGLLWAGYQTKHPDPRRVAPTFESPFAERFYSGDWQPNDLTKSDVQWMRGRISALRPQFEARGRGDWLDYSLIRLDQLGGHAQGAKDRVRP